MLPQAGLSGRINGFVFKSYIYLNVNRMDDALRIINPVMMQVP